MSFSTPPPDFYKGLRQVTRLVEGREIGPRGELFIPPGQTEDSVRASAIDIALQSPSFTGIARNYRHALSGTHVTAYVDGGVPIDFISMRTPRIPGATTVPDNTIFFCPGDPSNRSARSGTLGYTQLAFNTDAGRYSPTGQIGSWAGHRRGALTFADMTQTFWIGHNYTGFTPEFSQRLDLSGDAHYINVEMPPGDGDDRSSQYFTAANILNPTSMSPEQRQFLLDNRLTFYTVNSHLHGRSFYLAGRRAGDAGTISIHGPEWGAAEDDAEIGPLRRYNF